jgi:hypothetical protein
MANPTGSRTISFNVSEQYDIQDVVGEGAYGVVCYVYDLFRAGYWLTSRPAPPALIKISLCVSRTLLKSPQSDQYRDNVLVAISRSWTKNRSFFNDHREV